MVPDTQYLFDDDRGDSEPVTAAFEWMVANRASENIAFAAGLGDVTQDGLQNEVDRADAAYKILDRAKLPYSVLAGNHDINSGTDDTRPPSPYSNAFGPQRYANDADLRRREPGRLQHRPRLHAAAAASGWCSRSTGGISTAGIAWAQSMLDANKTVPTIVTTHETLVEQRGRHRAASPATASSCGTT